ncbi:histone-like nucleoid-structuring protein Lsr2 [Brachybacterium nesterenkovii]|uniref:Histone protein Lsr2 n=1 Tax=Brachybacterium nesterenkovii TaxID=47847 RepID=A0A1X6WZ53_9MICO|nr:Lsr2 family protein [Brachybacterium nesterenkovii]SLM91274.1 Histone protein Lsr2 [Brachybacterium nesterenkovii]
MARKTFIELIDDIDGSKAAETVTFSLDGVGYEIDLNSENAQKLRDELGTWISTARRVSGRRTSRSASASSSSEETARIRAWARENGYQVSDRGRISGEIRKAYQAAH